MALYMLLSSRSNLRYELDASAPYASGAALYTQLAYLLTTERNWMNADYTTPIANLLDQQAIGQYLWDAKTGLVTTSVGNIISALGMDNLYDPNGPCPKNQTNPVFNDETHVYNALILIPAPLSQSYRPSRPQNMLDLGSAKDSGGE